MFPLTFGEIEEKQGSGMRREWGLEDLIERWTPDEEEFAPGGGGRPTHLTAARPGRWPGLDGR